MRERPGIIILAESDPWQMCCPNCTGNLWENKTSHDMKHFFTCDTCNLSCVWQEVQG